MSDKKEHKKPRNAYKEGSASKHINKTHKTRLMSKTQIWILSVIAIAVLLAVSIITNGFGIFDAAKGTTEKVDFTLFVMSQCPYCKIVENSLHPVLKDIGDGINFKIEFVANENPDGSFSSLHGPNEVDGDIIWACAQKYGSENYKFMDMIVCQNKDPHKIPGNWEECAKEAGLDIEKIKECAEGDEGKQLLRESIAKSKSNKVTGTPTMFINDDRYSGGRQTNDLMRAICKEFNNPPEACSDIPPPVEVNLVVINDKRCKECDVTRLISQLKSIFPGLKVKQYDYSEEEGKDIYDNSGVKLLPAFLFDDSVSKGEGYPQVQKYLVRQGDYLSLRVGATFDPSKEICDNNIDDTNNGKVDCEDPDCSTQMICREEIPKKLDLFVMSECPFGTRALDSMKEVLDKFKDIDFGVYYIATENPDGSFNSLHGQSEVDEDIRQLCAAKLYRQDYKYMDYIWCQNEAISSGKKPADSWKDCAEKSGMDSNEISDCVDKEGTKLLSENIKLANGLGIGASPTWLANNKFQFSGIDKDTISTNFCSFNKNMAECS